MKTFRLVSVVAFLAAAACSNNTNNQTDASVEAGKEGGLKEAGIKDSGTPDVDNDAGPTTVDPECTLPADAGTGSCVTIADGGNTCNPITNAPCAADAGEACDLDQPGGSLSCYPPPPPNTAAVCAACSYSPDSGTACTPGATCVATAAGQQCAHFCCSDAECGAGHCDTAFLGVAPLGICVK